MAGRREYYVEGLSVSRAVEKLAGLGVPVLSARRDGKKGLYLQVDAKHHKKAFAILRGSCYNVKRTDRRGLSRFAVFLKKQAGLIAGALLFFAAAAFLQSRVLAVRVTGSGAYLGAQVEEILARGGVKRFSAPPAEYAPLRAAVLALPRVSFCSFRKEGGVLTVDVEVSEEPVPLKKELLVPATGTVEELTVIRGTPLVSVGEEVRKGETAVAGYLLIGGERREAVVIAQIKVKYPFSAEYAGDEGAALAQAALDFGEIDGVQTTKTESGYLVAGTAHAAAAVNLG